MDLRYPQKINLRELNPMISEVTQLLSQSIYPGIAHLTTVEWDENHVVTISCDLSFCSDTDRKELVVSALNLN